MTEGDGIVNRMTKELFCKMVMEWLIQVYKSIPEKIGQNAWKKKA
jgi:hypothetical protein